MRTYSGYMEGNKSGVGPKPKVSWMQIVPLALAAGVFLLFIVMRGGINSNGSNSSEADGMLSFHYAVKTADGYKTAVADGQLRPDIGGGILYAIEKGLKEPPEIAGYQRTIESNVYINSLYTDGSSAIIDFSAEPIAPCGDAEKNARLQAITYTVGDYFYVNNVVITVNGEIIYEMEYNPF